MRSGAGLAASVAMVLAVPLGIGASARPASAQESPAIKAAIQLAASGQGDSARGLVAAQLARARPGDPAYVEALYWSGRLASSGDSAENDFRRVAIEYSNSPWADQALLQLAELALAAGNGAGALQLAERLRNDYPGSPLRAQAAFWGGRAAFDVGAAPTACALLDSARTESPDDVEFLNQVAFYHSRCAVVERMERADTTSVPGATPTPAPGDTTHPAPAASAGRPAAPAAPAPARAPAPTYAVQVRATRSSRIAHDVLARLEQAGLHGRIEKADNGILRVRIGPYPSERAAGAAVQQVRRLLGGHPYVVPPS